MSGITILGATGFLGRALVQAALSRGLRVRAVTRAPRADFPADVEVAAVSDYLSTPAPRDVSDVLVHLAQSNLVDGSQDAGSAVLLVEKLVSLGYGYLCYASSAAVYGDKASHPHRADEAIVNPGPYARLKLDCEQRVAGSDGGAARFTNLFGPGQSGASVLARVLQQVPGDGPLRLRSLSPVRDFCWVEDAAAAVLDACAARLRGPFNVGAGRSVSVGDLARLALQAGGQPGRSVEGEEQGQPSELRVDISDTTAKCGWRPAITLETGLQKMMGGIR